ncbi:MAG: hypothetical protein V1822_01355 [Candidatus Micrarchaeota archaeon]
MQTTIAVESNTKEMLKLFGSKGQTYDQILKSLIEIAKLHSFHQKQKWILENESFAPIDEL